MSLRFTAEVIFWLSAVALGYTYVGYPILIAALSMLRPKRVRRDQCEPSVTVIITAYNEERALVAKLMNTIALEYPRDLMEIIVASDCSSDRTDEIAQTFHQQGVMLHRQPQRLGKTAAQNAAVEKARGEIIVFSDATSLYQPDALRKIVRTLPISRRLCRRPFDLRDPDDTDIGRGAKYWGYETFLKRHESTAYLIGVSGCLYAVRKSAARRSTTKRAVTSSSPPRWSNKIRSI
jgi:glycosyltransferase involved in cell wall biosynthesis